MANQLTSINDSNLYNIREVTQSKLIPEVE